MNLSTFKASDVIEPRTLAHGARLYTAEMPVEQLRWQSASGPVWSTPVGNDIAYAGFQADTRRGFKFVSVCRHCQAEQCAHLAALSLLIEHKKSVDLRRWQLHFDSFIRHNGYYTGRELPELPTYEEIFQDWMSTQAREATSAATSRGGERWRSNDDDKHIFLVTESGVSSGAACIRPGTSRPLKGKNKDQMTKVSWAGGASDRAFRNSVRDDPHLQRFVQWKALNQINHGRYDGDDHFDDLVLDESGIEMLRYLAGEGRLYCLDPESQRPVGPLAWTADRRPVEWTWQEESEKYWKVRPHVVATDCFFVGEPLFVDAHLKIIGLLDLGGMPAARVVAMLSSPPIPKEWLKENALGVEAIRCLPRPPDEVLKRSSRVISGVSPTPVLTVAVVGKQDVFSMSLGFRYDDVLDFFGDSADPIQFIKKGKQTIELVRDLPAETMAMNALADARLVLSNHSGDLRFQGDKAAQVEGFRGLLASDFASLRAAGFEIETVQGWSSKVIETADVDGGFGETDEDFSSPSAFLHFSLGFFIGEKRYNLLPLIKQLLEVAGGADGIFAMNEALKTDPDLKDFDSTLWVVDEDGVWIGLPRAKMAPWLGTLAELVADRKPRDFAEPSLTVSRIEALRLEAHNPDVDLGGQAATVIQELFDAKRSTQPLEIPGFHGTLQAFQCAGVRWMGVLGKYQLGGMLGDDRGLGKTWQCIGHLADLMARGALKAPALIVAPPTQIHHWRHHIRELAPEVRLLTLYGGERATLIQTVGDYDAVLTSWDTVVRYVEQLRKHHFHVAFLDETEKIHNASTLVSKGLRLLDIGYEIALNGSPLENNYGDVWAVVDAVLPGYLGTEASFKRTFRIPIEQDRNEARLKTLLMRIAPFMLRRSKDESGVQLPPVVHQDIPLRIHGDQANLYELIRLTTEQSVREAMEASGLRSDANSILPILTQLRQVCCAPSLTAVGREKGVAGSSKLDWINGSIDEMLGAGRRVLLVGFFVEFFRLVEALLAAKGIAYSKIVGNMPIAKREEQKQMFKRGETKVFLLGLKSGGRGTDLPEADTVVHLDPWYNPKAHDQATDRAHRMGQQNTVTAYRLFVEGSIEERVIDIQDRKRLFADSLDNARIFDDHKVTHEDILQMLKPLDQIELEDSSEGAAREVFA